MAQSPQPLHVECNGLTRIRDPWEHKTQRVFGDAKWVTMNVDQDYCDVFTMLDRTKWTTLSSKILLRPRHPHSEGFINREYPGTGLTPCCDRLKPQRRRLGERSIDNQTDPVA